MAKIVIGITLVVLMLVERANSQSPHPQCSSSGHPCNSVSGCCLQQDTCLTGQRETPNSLVVKTFCRNVKLDQVNGAQLLADDQPCSNSFECLNMCCRSGTCGKQKGKYPTSVYTCTTSLP